MKFRHVCGVALAAVTLGAFGCSQNPPAQQPTTTGATTSSPYDNSGNTGNVSSGAPMQNDQNGQLGTGAVDQNGTNRGANEGSMNTTEGSMQGQGQVQGQNEGQVGSGSFTSDGQIAAFLEAVNKAEIDQAHLALRKSNDPQVKAFAQLMITQHGQAERTVQRTVSSQSLAPVATPQVTQLDNQAQNDLSSLQSKNGNDFDRAYVDLQVQEHQKVIDMLDNKLMPAVHDNQLKQNLVALRPELEHHLQRAQAIQQHLGGGNTNP